jgi:hypothetical protein
MARCWFQHLLQNFSSSWFQASAAMKMTVALFCDIEQSSADVSGQPIGPLQMGSIRCCETSLNYWAPTLRCVTSQKSADLFSSSIYGRSGVNDTKNLLVVTMDCQWWISNLRVGVSNITRQLCHPQCVSKKYSSLLQRHIRFKTSPCLRI